MLAFKAANGDLQLCLFRGFCSSPDSETLAGAAAPPGALPPPQAGRVVFFPWGESSPENCPESRQGESHLPLCVRPADKGRRTLLYESVIYLPRCVAFGVLFFGISLFGRIRDFKGKCSEKLKCKVDAVNKSVVANPRSSILKLLFVMKVFWVFF